MRTLNAYVVLAIVALAQLAPVEQSGAQSSCRTDADTTNWHVAALQLTYRVADSAAAVSQGLPYARSNQVVAVTTPAVCDSALAAYNLANELTGPAARGSVYVIAIGSAGYYVFDPSYTPLRFVFNSGWQFKYQVR